MTRDTRFTRIEDDATEAAYADLCSEAYSVDRDAIPPWFQRCGRANMRVLRDGDEVIAGMMLVPMGLWLGGRSVTMNGVAGLAVRPDRRGASAATTLMTEALREMHQDGFALSGLNASSFRLYRGLGFEQAWTTCEGEGDLASLGRIHPPLEIRRETPADRAHLKDLYDRAAPHRHGALDRGPYVWERLRNPKDGITHGYVVQGPAGEPRGFAYLQRDWDDRDLRVVVTDWFAADHDAARSLLGLLAGEAAMARKLRFPTWPNDPMYTLLPERGFDQIEREPGMVRVIDLVAAFSGRGYAPHAEGVMELEVTDDLLPHNAGRFIVDIRNGAASVERGGSGALQVDARGLAPLLTGHLSPRALAIAGRLTGAPDPIEQAERLLAGPSPALPEFF